MACRYNISSKEDRRLVGEVGHLGEDRARLNRSRICSMVERKEMKKGDGVRRTGR